MAIPCPSALRPEQNRHRLADGWQGSTVRAILENPRYTGYAVFGRWTKHEVLLNPDDVAAGHVVRFRRSEPSRVVRSRTQAHPEIVTVETFTQAQLLRRSRAAGGMRGRAKLERTRHSGTRPYLLRGLMRCGICTRRMQGATIRASTRPTTVAWHGAWLPGSPALADHPRTVNLREVDLLEPLNAWIGQAFGRENVDRTVAALVASQGGDQASGTREAVKARLASAEARMRRFQAAIEAGVDPSALVESINEAQAQRMAARAELEGVSAPNLITAAEVYARIDMVGDVGAVLKKGSPEKIGQLYHDLGIDLRFWPEERAVDVTASPCVVSECVRGGTSTPIMERSPLFGVITPETIPVGHSRCHATTPVWSRPIRTEGVSIGFAEWGYIPTPGNRKPTIARALHLVSDPGACIAAGGPDATRPVLTRPSWSAPSIQDTRRVVQSAAARISATRRRGAGSSSAQTPDWTRRVHTSISRVPYRRWSSSRQLMT